LINGLRADRHLQVSKQTLDQVAKESGRGKERDEQPSKFGDERQARDGRHIGRTVDLRGIKTRGSESAERKLGKRGVPLAKAEKITLPPKSST